MQLGITGCGYSSEAHLRNLSERPEISFRAFADIEKTHAREKRDEALDYGIADEGSKLYEDHMEMIDEERLDGVIICTPHCYHAEQAISALEEDINVLLEKPIATSTDEVDEIRQALGDTDAGLQVNYQKRFQPRYQAAKEFIDQGKIGDILNLNAYRARDTYSGTFDTWRNDPQKAGGGKLIDLGNHTTDVSLWLVDQEPEEIKAVASNGGANVDMFSSVSAKLSEGTIASFNVSAKSPISKERIEIVGESGGVHIDKQGVRLYNEDSLEERINTQGRKPEINPDGKFVENIISGNFDDCIDQYARSVKLAEFAYEDIHND